MHKRGGLGLAQAGGSFATVCTNWDVMGVILKRSLQRTRPVLIDAGANTGRARQAASLGARRMPFALSQ